MFASEGQCEEPAARDDPISRQLGGLSVGLVAVALVGVYLLPTSTRRSLTFVYADPTVVTAYTAHFVHFTPTHLGSNLVAFVMLGVVIVVLLSRIGDRWLLVGTLTTLFVVIPVALSFLNLAVPRNSVTYGFSGITMALTGVLPIAIVRYLEAKLDRPIETTLLLASFFVSVGYVGAVTVPVSPTSAAVVIAAAVFGSAFAVHFSRANVGSMRRAATCEAFDRSLVVAVVAWILLLSVGFPRIEAGGNSVSNVYMHFIGYALGFTMAYLVHELRLFGDRPAKEKSMSLVEPAD